MAQRAIDAILTSARRDVAAGRNPDGRSLRERLRAAGADADAFARLERVLAVERARTLVGRGPAAAAPAETEAATRAALRTRPTVSANMEVRGEPGFVLAWAPAASVAEWEIRLSERPDARAGYIVRETLSLPAGATSVELPLADAPLRVHVLGRTRDGRLLRRAIVSGLSRASWDERWQRRPSAA